MKKKLVIGLTGGIASGKSSVLREFEKLGCRVFDCDMIARELVLPGKPALMNIIKTFGKSFVCADGRLKRNELGKVVFTDAKKRKTLESILHPAIISDLKKKIAGVRTGVVVADIPLLFELGLEEIVDVTVVVFVPPVLQRKRLLKRSHITSAEAVRMMSSQMPLSKKKNLADHVIDNSGTPSETKKQVRKILASLHSQ